MANKKIKFSKFLEDCKRIKKGEYSLEELMEDYKAGCYIPIRKKYETAKTTRMLMTSYMNVSYLDDLNSEDLGEYKYENLEIEEVYLYYYVTKDMLLLNEYLNLDNSVNNYTEKNYDIITQSGIFSFMQNFTKGDYLDFSEKVDQVTGMKNYSLNCSILDLLKEVPTNDSLKLANESLQNGLDKLGESGIQNLAELIKFNDPITQEIVNGLNDASVKTIK